MTPDEHLAHHDAQMALLTSLLERQQELHAVCVALHTRLLARQDSQADIEADHASRTARLEDLAAMVQLTLDAFLEILRSAQGAAPNTRLSRQGASTAGARAYAVWFLATYHMAPGAPDYAWQLLDSQTRALWDAIAQAVLRQEDDA